MSKISLEYKLKPNGIADLSTMLNEIKSINENWSLNGMLVHLVCVSFFEVLSFIPKESTFDERR